MYATAQSDEERLYQGDHWSICNINVDKMEDRYSFYIAISRTGFSQKNSRGWGLSGVDVKVEIFAVWTVSLRKKLRKILNENININSIL